MKHTVASRSIGRGLAKVEPTSPNTLIAYCGQGRIHGARRRRQEQPVHDRAAPTHLTTPGLDVRMAFGFVRDDVLKSTGNRQEPFVYGSLGGDDVPLVPARAVPSEPAPKSPAQSPQADVRRDYELALQIGNKAAFSAFLAQYPDGFYASLAKLQLEKIAAEQARVAATEKAQAAEAERARLAAAGAQKEAQAKAEADAKLAEQARLAAEKAKQVAQDQAAEAERKRTETAAADAAAVKPATAAPPPEKATNLAALDPRTAAGRCHQIGAGRVASRRLPLRGGRWRLERGVAALAVAVQPLRGNEIRRQGRLQRGAGRDQAEIVAGLPAGLRARLQGRRRSLRQDRLRRRLVPQRRQ